MCAKSSCKRNEGARLKLHLALLCLLLGATTGRAQDNYAPNQSLWRRDAESESLALLPPTSSYLDLGSRPVDFTLAAHAPIRRYEQQQQQKLYYLQPDSQQQQQQQKMGPQFSKEPPSLIHYLNSSDLVIPCSAQGNPQPTIVSDLLELNFLASPPPTTLERRGRERGPKTVNCLTCCKRTTR